MAKFSAKTSKTVVETYETALRNVLSEKAGPPSARVAAVLMARDEVAQLAKVPGVSMAR